MAMRQFGAHTSTHPHGTGHLQWKCCRIRFGMTREHQGNYSEQCVDFHDWFELDYNRECDTTGSRGGRGLESVVLNLGMMLLL